MDVIGKTEVQRMPWDTPLARFRVMVKTHGKEIGIAAGVVAVAVLGFEAYRHQSRLARFFHKTQASIMAPSKATPAPIARSTAMPAIHKAAATPKAPASPADELVKAGLVYYKAKDYDRAVDTFKDAVSADEKDSEAYYWLAESYKGLQKDSKSCKWLGKYLEVAPAGKHSKSAHSEIKKCT